MDLVEKASVFMLNYESIEMKVNRLQSLVDRIEAKAAVLRDRASSIEPPYALQVDVAVWLRKQNKASEEFLQLDENSQSHRWFNLPNSLLLHRDIRRLHDTFNNLSQSESFLEVSCRMKFEGEVRNLATDFVGDGFQNGKLMIGEWLQSDIEVAGICGIGGIGKTSLLEDVYYTLTNDTRYRICWVAMKKDSTITDLQDAIATILGIYPLKGYALQRRIEFQRTLKLIKNLVIILDNLCDWISLEEAGIPLGENGCKLIISTRSLTICREMKCQRYIKMEYLEDKESWDLFVRRCGKIEREFEEYARSLVQKCDGLPLAILELARQMSEVGNLYEWEYMWHCMQSSTFENFKFRKSFKMLHVSFLGLENSHLKDCFLFCSLFPNNYLVERKKIIQGFLDGGLIEQACDPSFAYNWGHSILTKLENVFLLIGVIDQSGKKFITMHSLVRDFAKGIVKSSDIDKTIDNDRGRMREVYEKWEGIVQSYSRDFYDKFPTSTKDVIEDGSSSETHVRRTASSSTHVPTSTADVIQEEVRKMAETVFGPALEVIKHCKSEDGEMLTDPFLLVCKITLPVIENFGALMSEVKIDFGGNIKRLESKYNSNCEQFNHLYDMVRGEVEAKTAQGNSSCANALLWLTRSMDFLLALFHNLRVRPDWPLSQVCAYSYVKTLKKWNGSIASSAFNVAPDRKKFMEVIGGSDYAMDDVDKFCTSFAPLLEENHKFLASVGMDEEQVL